MNKLFSSPQIPVGVNLTAERHGELIAQLIAGRVPDATPAEARAGLLAGNSLLTAYWSLIVANARAKAPSQAAADDRAGAAGERAVHAIRSYDPRAGSIMGWLKTCRVWGGEAGFDASMPLVSTTRAERRASWAEGEGVEPMLSLDLAEGAGDSDDFAVRVDLELDVEAALLDLEPRGRGWLAAAYGIGGCVAQPTEELAAVAGVSVHTVRRSLARSRETLRGSLQDLAFAA